MTRVPEHDGEQEGEGGDGEDGGVHLPVAVHAVGVHQALHSTAGGVGMCACYCSPGSRRCTCWCGGRWGAAPWWGSSPWSALSGTRSAPPTPAGRPSRTKCHWWAANPPLRWAVDVFVINTTQVTLPIRTRWPSRSENWLRMKYTDFIFLILM